MVIHPPTSILFVAEADSTRLQSLFVYLKSMQHVQLTVDAHLPHDLAPYDVVVTSNTASFTETDGSLRQFVNGGGGWLGLVDLSEKPLPATFGAQPGPVQSATELRVLFQDYEQPLARRLPEAIYVAGQHQALDRTTEGTQVTLYADWHYAHSPVLVRRSVGEGQVACTTLQAYENHALQQLLYRLLRELASCPGSNETLGIGLLGYAPSVGRVHGLGAEATPGFSLRAACDLDPERLRQARQDFPELRTLASAATLADDPDVDLVIIATPPNTHAELAIQMMAAGKHVVSEKPLALSRTETAAMADMAARQKVHLSCYQNRRWDVDYLAIRQALADGLIGDLFYMETFVGGYDHPCGYWHSHDTISGGASYDWGGHYLDWVVSLIRDRVTAVIGTRQNRVWQDVTNADQERIQIRFAGGQEAEFMHSDIAAVRKPKWYLLGTEGAIIGHWQDVTAYETEPVLYFHRHDIPATEMPPDLSLYRRHHSGQIVAQEMAVPNRQHYLFHRNLADHLLTGEPITAPLDDSIRVVEILEAAKRSATNGGRVEVLGG